MLDVAVVQEVKHAMAEHDGLALTAEVLAEVGKGFLADDFVLGCVHTCSLLYLLRYLNQSAVASLIVSGVQTGAFRQ